MTDLIQTPVHTTGVVDDYFIIEAHLLSTRSADAYKAIDKGTKTSVCLWQLRHPLALNSDAVRRYLTRISTIQRLELPIYGISSFGVDAAGVAFSVFPALNGHPLIAGRVDLREAERRFMSCLRLVEMMHGSGIVCGDLCGASFWVDRSGDVAMIGVMGSFDSEAAATAMLPPVDTLHYVAPEQRSGGGIEQASDVFALGVLGYYLFTGKYPFGPQPAMLGGIMDPAKIEPINVTQPNAPAWVQKVLMKCLAAAPENRYRSAGQVAESIVEEKQRQLREEQAPAPLQKVAANMQPVRTSGTYAPVSTSARKPEVDNSEAEREEREIKRRKSLRWKVALVMAVVFAVAFAVGFRLTQQEQINETRLQHELKSHIPAIDNPELQNVVPGLINPDTAPESREAQLETLSQSDDPLSHAMLVKFAIDAPTQAERELAVKSVLARAERLGLGRTTAQVRQWLRKRQGEARPEGFMAVMKAVDATLPVEAHKEALHELYPADPETAMRIAASLALDTKRTDQYGDTLGQFVADAEKLEGLSGRSTAAIVLASRDLSVIYGNELADQIPNIPNDDVLWLLRVLAQRGDVHLKELSSLAVSRNLIPPLRQVFVVPINEKEGLPAQVIAALIKGSAGALEKSDLVAFGKWYDVSVERILVAICADDYPAELRQEAFEILASKTIIGEPVATLVSWIRKEKRDAIGKYAQAMGRLGLESSFTDDQLRDALATFDELAARPEFARALLKGQSVRVLKLAMQMYGSRFGLATLLQLLDHPDKDVRIAALGPLKGTNDIGALKIIIDHYEAETDKDVRKHYEDNFWVIRGR